MMFLRVTKTIIIVLNVYICLITSTAYGRDYCGPNLAVHNCGREKKVKRFTYYVYHQTIAVSFTCDNYFDTIEWSFEFMGYGYGRRRKGGKSYDMSEFNNKYVATFDKDKYQPGRYRLTVDVSALGGSNTFLCEVHYLSEPPVLLFSPSAVQYILPGTAYTIDLKKSINHAKKQLEPKYSISCQFKNTPLCANSKTCTIKEKELTFTKIHDLCHERVNITATVKHDDENVTATASIIAKEFLAATTSIECTKNCDAYGNEFSNPKVSIALELKCLKLCLGFNKLTPTWDIKVGTTSLSKNKYKFADEAKTHLIINDDALQPGVTATVEATCPGKYTASYYIKTTPVVPKPKCTISPTNGISLETTFKITCETTGSFMKTHPMLYRVMHYKSGTHKPILAETAFPEIEVIVGATKGKAKEQLVVTGHDIFFNEMSVNLPLITLTSAKLDPGKIVKEMDKIEETKKMGNVILVMQKIQGLVSEMLQTSFGDSVIGVFLKSIMKTMTEMSLGSVYLYNQLTSMLPMFYEVKDQSEEYKTELSTMCQALSQINLEGLLKSKYGKLEEKSAKEYSGQIRKCIDSLIEKPPEEELIPEIIVTTPGTVVSEPAVSEDYPDYDNMFVNPQIEKQKKNAMAAILEASQTVAATMVAGESYSTKTNSSKTVMQVDAAKDMAGKEFQVDGATVKASDNIVELADKKITTVITSYKSDVIETDMHLVNTNIIDVGFFDLTKSIEKSVEGVQINIVFDIMNSTIVFEKYPLMLPESDVTEDLPIDYLMNVHRLQVLRHTQCNVKFDQVVSILEVVFTKNRRPNIKDFDGKTFIVDSSIPTSLNIHFPFAIDDEDDYFGYAAILPKDRDSSPHVSYNISFMSVSCVLFDETESNWKPASCDSSLVYNNNDSKIQCVCNHSSLFAATFRVIESKLDLPKLNKFVTILYHNYIVILHVVVVFICYCITVCFAVLRKRSSVKKGSIFFLSDNLKNDRYGYLLEIKTGTFNFAGTTSNIVIKIFGSKTDSKPHVLNYPDPEKRMLQRNKTDWFILTNDYHLGEILLIRLWFDSIGVRPSWYCEKVTIIDLQDKKMWEFFVEQWLDLLIQGHHEIKCEPSIRLAQSYNVITSMKKFVRMYSGPDHTWNIFSKLHDDQLSFEQRITVILSIIYTTYTFSVAFIYPPQMRTSDAYGYGKFYFYYAMVSYAILSSLAASCMNLPFVYFFRNSQKGYDSNLLVRTESRFSYRVTNITWGILITWILICTVYLIIFGFWVTFNTALVWIVTTIFSLLLSIFVVENLYIVVYNIMSYHFTKIVAVSYYNFVLVLKEIEMQRKLMFKTLGELLMRPYFQHHYHNLTLDYIRDMIIYEKQRLQVSQLFRDMCVFIVYILLLYIICLSNSDDLQRVCNHHIKLMVIDGVYSESNMPLMNIESINDIYDYINITIINTIHATTWYPGFNKMDGGLMVDFNTKILGVVQLRQQRSSQTCENSDMLRSMKTKCFKDPPIFENWAYNDGTFITSTLGELQTYSGEGYTINLGRTMYNSYYIVHFLKKNKWIDVNTKVLFIEFWAYNANHNIFNAIRVIIERDSSGQLLKSYQIFTTRLFYSSIIVEILISILLVVFSLVIVSRAIKHLVVFFRERRIFCTFWHILDMILIALSIAIVTIYLLKNRITRELLEELTEAAHNEFVSYFAIITLRRTNTFVSGLLLCLATIRLWKFLRFGRIFQIMERTLAKSAGLLGCIAIYHLDVFLMFCIYLYVIFGPYFHEFRSFAHTLITFMLLTFSFKNPKYDDLSIQYSAAKLSFVVFMIINLILLSVYATIIMINLSDGKTYFSNIPQQYTIKDYVIEEAMYHRELFKRDYKELRLKSGGLKEVKERELVYPKEPAQRYANCVTISDQKLRIMRMVAICIIRRNRRLGRKTQDLSELDYNALMRLCLTLKLQEDAKYNNFNHMYFVSKDETCKFVPDTRLLKMEFVVQKLLSGSSSGGDGGEVEKDREEMRKERMFALHVSGDEKRLKLFRDTLDAICKAVDNIKLEIK